MSLNRQYYVVNTLSEAPPQPRGGLLGLWFDKLTTLSLSKGRDGGVSAVILVKAVKTLRFGFLTTRALRLLEALRHGAL